MDETNDGYKADNLNDRAWLMAGLAAFNRNPRLATFKKCADRDAGLPTLVSTGRVPIAATHYREVFDFRAAGTVIEIYGLPAPKRPLTTWG